MSRFQNRNAAAHIRVMHAVEHQRLIDVGDAASQEASETGGPKSADMLRSGVETAHLEQCLRDASNPAELQSTSSRAVERQHAGREAPLENGGVSSPTPSRFASTTCTAHRAIARVLRRAGSRRRPLSLSGNQTLSRSEEGHEITSCQLRAVVAGDRHTGLILADICHTLTELSAPRHRCHRSNRHRPRCTRPTGRDGLSVLAIASPKNEAPLWTGMTALTVGRGDRLVIKQTYFEASVLGFAEP